MFYRKFFYIIWEDDENNRYKKGVLAQIDKMFYVRMHKRGQSISVEDNKKETAYDNGCIGITGFKRDRVYKASRLFEFFEKRLLNKSSADLCKELKEKRAVSMVDSFSIEEMPEELRKDCKEVILEMYEMQEKERLEENLKNI